VLLYTLEDLNIISYSPKVTICMRLWIQAPLDQVL